MKNLLLIALLLLGTGVFAQGKSKVTVEWQYTNVIEGYDHLNKMKVYIDGKYVGESKASPQSKLSTYKFKTTQGPHQVKIVNYALYEGKWEEHTIALNYSIDAIYDQKLTIKKKMKIKLTFDIDTTETKVEIL